MLENLLVQKKISCYNGIHGTRNIKVFDDLSSDEKTEVRNNTEKS